MDKITIRADGSWEFKGEDSRLSRSREDKQVTYKVFNPLTGRHEWQTMDRVFCMNCGADGGLSARTAFYVKFICDKCWVPEKFPHFVPMPEHEEWLWRNGLKPDDLKDKK